MKNKVLCGGLLLIAILMFVILIANKKTALQVATNATVKQSKTIEKILKQENIGYSSEMLISLSENSILDGMDQNWEAYDLINKDGSNFLLILRKADKDFTALLDSENNLLCGLIDNGVLPKLFE